MSEKLLSAFCEQGEKGDRWRVTTFEKTLSEIACYLAAIFRRSLRKLR